LHLLVIINSSTLSISINSWTAGISFVLSSTVFCKEYYLQTGETIVMPKGEPHSVFGEEKFKMILVVSF